MSYVRPTVRQVREEQTRRVAAEEEAERWRTELNRVCGRLGLVLDDLGAPRIQDNGEFGLSLEGRIRKLAAAAVAEAREPLVAALKGTERRLTLHSDAFKNSGDITASDVFLHEARLLAAALAKGETV